MKVCMFCKIEKEFKYFAKNSFKKDGLQARCKACSNKTGQYWYRENKLSVRTRTIANKLSSTQFVIEYLQNHPCVDCGESDIIVLDFDHLRDKRKNVSKMAQEGYSIETILKEIAKCEVVCANDHRRRTALRANSKRYRIAASTEGFGPSSLGSTPSTSANLE